MQLAFLEQQTNCPVINILMEWLESSAHRSTRPIKMLSRVQKLYKIEHVTESQRSSAPVHGTQVIPVVK
jgi:hypothetical protein